MCDARGASLNVPPLNAPMYTYDVVVVTIVILTTVQYIIIR